MGQGVPGPIENRQRGVRKIRGGAHRAGEPDGRILPPGHQQRRRLVGGRRRSDQLPMPADPFHGLRIGQLRSGRHETLIAFQHAAGVEDEILRETPVFALDPGHQDPVLGNLGIARQQRADQGQSSDPLRRGQRHRPRVVGPGGMAGQQVGRPAAGPVREVEQDLQHILGAPDFRPGCGSPHPGQVRIDAPIPRHAVEGRLEAGLRLAVVDAAAVENEHRHPGSVFGVVHHGGSRGNIHWPMVRPPAAVDNGRPPFFGRRPASGLGPAGGSCPKGAAAAACRRARPACKM